VEVRENANLALFDGDVQVLQGDMQLNADSLKVHYDPSADDGPQILRLDAQGNIIMTSPSERAESKWAIYDVEQRVLTLGGDVQLTRGDSKIWGERLELNLRTGITTLDGASRSTERVKGRFTVPEQDETKN
jgi:lipopolysaccharide export system protein LptA